MFESEFIKSMNCNFERIRLAEKPEEKRYQYCIINRGGIRGLLPCSLRVINGDAYLYYDISSKQSVSQLFYKKSIDRRWIKDFVWNMRNISMELSRFLLDESNIIWYPEQIYQDLGSNKWSFLYYPYYSGDSGFRKLLEFIIEKLDYKDEVLVECIYKVYEQYDSHGEAYLKEKIYQDIEVLDEDEEGEDMAVVEKSDLRAEDIVTYESFDKISASDISKEIAREKPTIANILSKKENDSEDAAIKKEKGDKGKKDKKGLWAFLEGAKRKDRESFTKETKDRVYEYDNRETLEVAEENDFYSEPDKEEIGKTIYIENIAEKSDNRRRIFNSEGQVLKLLEKESVVIGKKKEDADMIIDNSSISRIHARIFYADGEYMLEDLNSTNGTFKNGLRLRPYEKRKLSVGDEIKLGSVALMYS